jgi:hypothetical protein
VLALKALKALKALVTLVTLKALNLARALKIRKKAAAVTLSHFSADSKTAYKPSKKAYKGAKARV